MFGLGLPEIIVILIVALLVVGPSKLPELARSLGKAFGDFRRMADEVKETIEEAVIKEETPKDEAAKEETAKEETPNTETAKAENFWEHDVYGQYNEAGDSDTVPDAQQVAQEEVPGGHEKQTETKIKEA